MFDSMLKCSKNKALMGTAPHYYTNTGHISSTSFMCVEAKAVNFNDLDLNQFLNRIISSKRLRIPSGN